MAKILTDKEMAKIILDAVDLSTIDDRDQYLAFLEDIADVICKHFGADRSRAELTADLGYNVAFNINENTPDDGGVFDDYDTDVTWRNGKEEE